MKAKRVFDILMSLGCLFLMSPFFLLIAIAILVDDGRPVLFKQQRLGYDGKQFSIFKFRTMTSGDHSESYNDKQIKINQKVTRPGVLLRKTSLDETPQLLNILKGDMSIIGPRPVLPNHLHKYDNYQKQRLGMKPGVTGWAQVNGRHSIPWSKRIEYDVWYVKNYSFLLDFKILLKTIKVVLFREGVSNNQTMGEQEDFDDKRKEK
ncbi:hypothetical protein GCM10010954_21880 [Halobacillus andaensis]|uniref:Bacterial sugar transferase domain-containing protein n=1 Tax=Halobacillus andaensis TaxID=1176239 RepID=A0A917B646_HALAA|nr:sugar transferase [Halobacillus andaensis]MBP2004303.1 lipopolysaccharide/colanic/teichoic acid biosynthesis glycosyltransferase [Halobacillus andaensis]GGF22681.1 hypothetical protein GCM10010954_21880 [Halobacillus andaensis]